MASMLLVMGAATAALAGEDKEKDHDFSEIVISTDNPPIGPGALGADLGLSGTNEPCVAANPINAQNVAMSSLFNYRVSTNGGSTWSASFVNIVPSGYGQDGDACMAFDSQGRLFYSYQGFHVASGGADEFVCELNPTTGSRLSGPIKVSTSGTTGAYNDKDWLAADRWTASPFRDRLYLVWSEFPTAGNVRVLFSYSTDHGLTWATPLQLSSSGDGGFPWPAHVAVAKNGDVFVSYHDGSASGGTGRVWLLRSTNGGVSFPQKNLAFTAGQADTTYNVQSSGGAIPGTAFWLQGSGQAWVLPDPIVSGSVYVVASDDPDNVHGSGDDSNIYIARSTNNGVTWNSPLRVDHGTGTSFQVMPTAAIDDGTGCIVVMWYDNRAGLTNGSGHYLLDVFYTISGDHGLTFGTDVQINDAHFDPDVGAPQRFAGPPPTLRIGEYIGVAYLNHFVYAVWCGNSGGSQQTIFDSANISNCGDCNNNGVSDIEDIANGTSQDCNSNVIPDECESPTDCNSNGVQDFCDIARGTSLDCNSNRVPDECDVPPIGPGNDCNHNLIPDECESQADCNRNGIRDICDIASGASQDCNSNGIPDECEMAAPVAILSEDFEAGLPGTWTATGLWHVSSVCPRSNTCNPANWAYYGRDTGCNFNTGATNSGVLTAPAITIAPSVFGATLTYCYAYQGEGGNSNTSGSDWAWVSVNGVEVDDISLAGVHTTWTNRSVDLSAFAGQTITLTWNFDSRGTLLNNGIGLQVDHVQVTQIVPGILDCNQSGRPDSCDIASGASLDCDLDGVPDECEYPGCAGILPADMNCDARRDGRDIPRFVAMLVANHYTCQADMNQDGMLNLLDVPGFAAALLAGP